MVLTEHNTLSEGLKTRDIARQKYSDSIVVLVGQEYVSILRNYILELVSDHANKYVLIFSLDLL
jgi:hypothetical protein